MKKQLLIGLFTLLTASLIGQIDSVGIIGTATPGGWDEDTFMEQDPDSADLWTLSITLTDGEMKFRANGSWDVNWGSTNFPIGVGELDGPNIEVIGGDYEITFNSATGDFFFDYSGTVGIIGSASPLGWDRDVFMFEDSTNPSGYFLTLELEAGEAKFRQDGAWDVNWGAEGFPSDTAERDGPNIPIPSAGTYEITFDTLTGVYHFEELVAFDSISIIGGATPGGWDEDTQLSRDPDNPDLWTANVSLDTGELKFRANNDWAVNWGGEGWPTDTATLNGPNIEVPEAGDYLVSFNTNSLVYEFLPVETYDVVSIIGDATPGGWDNDTDMLPDPDEESLWSLRVELADGEMKFRANNEWTVNWGGPDFPEGTATLDGPNIPVVAGEYNITFNSTTGEYAFEEIVEYDAVSLVGQSGPFGAWPNPDEHDPGARDLFMDKDPNDGNLWRVSEVELVDYDEESDGGLKFRADTAWDVNWGAEDFPEGVGTLSGPNIEPTAGTYDVFFNASTGEYVFSPSSSAENVRINPSDVAVSPNPARQSVWIDLNRVELSGEVQVTVFSMNGNRVLERSFRQNTRIEMNVSHLSSGQYIVRITDGQTVISKKMQVIP